MKATAKAVLPYSIETVFSCVADITRMPCWISNFSAPRWVPRGDYTKPPVFMGKYKFNGRYYDLAIQVQALHPPSRLILQSDTVPFAFTSQVELHSSAGQTHIAYSLEADSGNVVVKLLILIFGRVAARMLRKQLEADLQVLSDLLSSDSPHRPGAAGELVEEVRLK